MMPPEPLVVNPNPLDFGHLPQGRSKTFQVLIRNPSQKTLIWRADAGETSWLTLDKSIGTIPPGGQQPVNVMADTGSLALGGYAATLTFTSEGDSSSASVKVPIKLTIPGVLPPAVGLSFSLFLASSKTLPLAITNRDNQIVNWTMDTGGANWLTLDRNKGTLQPHEVQTLYVTANASSLNLGDYAATLTYSSEAGGNKSADASFPVELHVSLRPYSDNGPHSPVVAAGQAVADGTVQGKSTVSVQVTNPQENGQVKWAMSTGGVNWVTVDPGAGILQGGGQTTVVATTDKRNLKDTGDYRTDLLLSFTFDTATDPTKVDREPTSVAVPIELTVP